MLPGQRVCLHVYQPSQRTHNSHPNCSWDNGYLHGDTRPVTPTLEITTPTFFPQSLPKAPTEVGISTPGPSPNTDNGSLTGKIAFTCYVQQIDQIGLMNADGSGRKQLTKFSATTFYPSVSPDGKTIYFVSREKGTFDIYSMAVDGGDVERLTNGIKRSMPPNFLRRQTDRVYE